MAYVRAKKINGCGPYYYLVRSERVNGVPKQIHIKYLGKSGKPGPVSDARAGAMAAGAGAVVGNSGRIYEDGRGAKYKFEGGNWKIKQRWESSWREVPKKYNAELNEEVKKKNKLWLEGSRESLFALTPDKLKPGDVVVPNHNYYDNKGHTHNTSTDLEVVKVNAKSVTFKNKYGTFTIKKEAEYQSYQGEKKSETANYDVVERKDERAE